MSQSLIQVMAERHKVTSMKELTLQGPMTYQQSSLFKITTMRSQRQENYNKKQKHLHKKP